LVEALISVKHTSPSHCIATQIRRN
jgi:hypothetical protein